MDEKKNANEVKVLIGVYFNEDAIMTERYEGTQSIGELDRILPTYQGQAIVKNMVGRGTIGYIPEARDGAVRLLDAKERKHPRVIMQTIDDLARLKDESVRAVKLDRLKANEEAQKDSPRKKRYDVSFAEDDWRPDEIYLVERGQGEWDGRLVWRRLVNGEWVIINPPLPVDNSKTKTEKKNTRKAKRNATVHAPKEQDHDDALDDVPVQGPSDDDAKYASMLDRLGDDDDYDFEE